MKKYIILAIGIILTSCCLLSCSGRSIYAMEQEAKREAIYEDGYAAGYDEGIEEAKHDIAFYVDDDLFSLACDIEDQYGICPEDAIMMLENYADGEPYTNEEIETAIWVVSCYYHRSHEIINRIEEYLVG